MADQLADELLQMILAPSLTLSHEQFISPSPAAFGENDSVSSASALLVCKRWLRVATPLLYETVVVRSTGQSHALADALRRNPAFAEHVKKIRLEGAYASLDEVLTRCTKLTTLVVLLRVYSDASVNGFCRALPMIDPTDVILRDEWQIDNAKIRKVFIALCAAIPKWKNLTTFAFPYHSYGYGGSIITPGVTRRTRLIEALTQSISLRLICCGLPEVQFEHWRSLALIPSIKLRFTYDSKPRPWQSRVKEKILDDVLSDKRLSITSFEFIDPLETSPTPEIPKQQDAVSMTPFKLSTTSSVTDDIWTAIFAFATVPGHPDRPDLFYQKFGTGDKLHHFNVTRNSLSLVSKHFKRLIRPTYFAYPLLLSVSSLHKFMEKVCDALHLGRQVHVLSMASLTRCDQINDDLCTLIPYLTCLRHFIGWGCSMAPSCMSIKSLKLLAEAAGDSVRTVTKINLMRDDEPLPLTLLNSFNNLVKLEILSEPRIMTTDKIGLQPNSLSRLRELSFGYDLSIFVDTLTLLRLPELKFVKFAGAYSPTVENFLGACGACVEELDLKGFAKFVDVFNYAPNLLDLRWEPRSSHNKDSLMLSAALSLSAAHGKLQRFAIRDILAAGTGEREQFITINAFFNRLDFSKFPSLTEIHFESYSWPTDDRTVSRDLLHKMAVKVKQNHGIDIKDCSGKPWRPRVQKRR